MAKTPERHVEMADGTILDADIGAYDPDLWIMYRDNTSMMVAARQCSNPEKTHMLIYRYPGYEQIYEGYTSLMMIKTGDGHVQARLRRG